MLRLACVAAIPAAALAGPQMVVHRGDVSGPVLANAQPQPVALPTQTPEFSTFSAFTIENTGDADLVLIDIEVGAPFEVLSPLPPQQAVHPGQSLPFFVVRPAFTANGSYAGTLVIDSNSQGGPRFQFGVSALVETPTPPVPPNIPPIAVPDGPVALDSHAAITIDVLANDIETENQPLTITAISTPGHGTATLSADGRTIVYDPANDYGGDDAFAYTISDGKGGSATALVKTIVPPPFPVVKVIHVGGPVPFGTPVPLGSGTMFAALGVPSVNGSGVLAHRAELSDGRVVVMAGDPPRISLANGDSAADVQDATIKAFGEPLWNDENELTFLGSMAGKGVRSGNNEGVWSAVAGNGLQLIAQKGAEPPGVPGARWTRFLSLAVENQAAAFLATMAGRGVNAHNDMALWLHAGSLTAAILRDGDAVTVANKSRKVRQFTALNARAGFGLNVSGQGNGLANGRSVARLTTTDGVDAIAVVGAGYFREVASEGGEAPGYGAGSKFLLLDQPTQSVGNQTAFTATVRPRTGSATTKNNVAVFADGAAGLERIAARADAAPGISGAAFDRFGPPVANTKGVAFFARVAGKGAVTGNDNTGIWWKTSAGLSLLARADVEAAGAPGAKWKSFTSLALPESAGPLFAATLQRKVGGVTAQDDAGLWMVDRNGVLQLLLRTGQSYKAGNRDRTIRQIQALELVPGSPAQTRNHSASGEVACRVTFTDGTHGIVLIAVP